VDYSAARTVPLGRLLDGETAAGLPRGVFLLSGSTSPGGLFAEEADAGGVLVRSLSGHTMMSVDSNLHFIGVVRRVANVGDIVTWHDD
jgi:hypothetical protein